MRDCTQNNNGRRSIDCAKSRRLKYLQLKISPEVGLEVIVPYRFGYYDLHSFLTLHREWIEKKLQTYQKKAQENKSLPMKFNY